MYYIHPIECIECGMCESICPVDAIRYDDEVPEGEEAYAALNQSVFRDQDGKITEPGGWKKGDAPLDDTEILKPLVSNLKNSKGPN